jgi:hypothetical protein
MRRGGSLEKKEKRGLRFRQCSRQHEKTAKEREKAGQERCNESAHLRKQKTLSDPEEDEETQKDQPKKHKHTILPSIKHTNQAQLPLNSQSRLTNFLSQNNRSKP